MKRPLLVTLVCGSIDLQGSHAGENFCLLSLGNYTYMHRLPYAPVQNVDSMRNWTAPSGEKPERSTSVAFTPPFVGSSLCARDKLAAPRAQKTVRFRGADHCDAMEISVVTTLWNILFPMYP